MFTWITISSLTQVRSNTQIFTHAYTNTYSHKHHIYIICFPTPPFQIHNKLINIDVVHKLYDHIFHVLCTCQKWEKYLPKKGNFVKKLVQLLIFKILCAIEIILSGANIFLIKCPCFRLKPYFWPWIITHLHTIPRGLEGALSTCQPNFTST